MLRKFNLKRESKVCFSGKTQFVAILLVYYCYFVKYVVTFHHCTSSPQLVLMCHVCTYVLLSLYIQSMAITLYIYSMVITLYIHSMVITLYIQSMVITFIHSMVITCDYSAICCQNGGTDREAAVRTVSHVPGLQALWNELFHFICAQNKPNMIKKHNVS